MENRFKKPIKVHKDEPVKPVPVLAIIGVMLLIFIILWGFDALGIITTTHISGIE